MAQRHQPASSQEADLRQPYHEGAYASVPTGWTRFLRTFLPWQLLRFAALNVRMLQMISKSHH